VKDFVARTGAEVLAVAVDTSTANTRQPQLRWDVLQDIASATHVPLVPHGASGIPAQRSIDGRGPERGKVNFKTELRTGILATPQEQLPGHRVDGENL
jgi:tagatose 1,6-diphosphate aldolase GatY/KbaY